VISSSARTKMSQPAFRHRHRKREHVQSTPLFRPLSESPSQRTKSADGGGGPSSTFGTSATGFAGVTTAAGRAGPLVARAVVVDEAVCVSAGRAGDATTAGVAVFPFAPTVAHAPPTAGVAAAGTGAVVATGYEACQLPIYTRLKTTYTLVVSAYRLAEAAAASFSFAAAFFLFSSSS
jgi:hypothetical protein